MPRKGRARRFREARKLKQADVNEDGESEDDDEDDDWDDEDEAEDWDPDHQR